MQVHLSYGNNGLDVALPDGTDVIEPMSTPALPDVAAALRAALAQPIGTPPLAELVGPDDEVAIVISDLTRPAPNAVLVAELLAVIGKRGVPRDQISIIVGAGLHRAMSRAELERMLGPTIVAGYRIVIHDARDPDGMIFLERYPGEQRGGIYLNATYMRANVRIVTGFVEPHLFAGFSGGGKGVFPGVAAAHNIIRNHGVANLMHPGAGYGVAEGNPVFEEMRRVAVHSNVAFLCNVTMNPDKGVTSVFCGDLVQAQDAAIAQVKRQALCPIPYPYDIVVASNGGFPADLNLYQSVKGMVAAAQAVRQGGQIVLAAECREGPGSAEYTAFLHSRETPEALLAMLLAPDFHRIDQWQVLEQVLVQRKAEVHLYSAMDAATIRASHLAPSTDVGETVSALAETHQREYGRAPRILALPYGFQAIPVLENTGK